jgi:hypothetical protein
LEYPWYRLIKAAERFHMHPADVAGVPHLKAWSLWTYWAEVVSAAEADALKRLVPSKPK